MQDAILYAELNNRLYIRAIGRMTAPLCVNYRRRIFERLEMEPPVKNVYLDLSKCSYMDSTFMGIIIGINKKLKSRTQQGITVVCPTEECNVLFASLNIANLLAVNTEQIDFPLEMELISRFEKPTPELVLKAHEDLAELSKENAARFRLLREMLQKKIEDNRHSLSSPQASDNNSKEELDFPGKIDDLNEDNSLNLEDQ